MSQGDMDDIAVMDLLLAWDARQLEPETMEQLNIVCRELGVIGAEGKQGHLAIGSDDTQADGVARPLRQLVPGTAKIPGLQRRRHDRGTARDNLQSIELGGGVRRGLRDI